MISHTNEPICPLETCRAFVWRAAFIDEDLNLIAMSLRELFWISEATD